MVIISETTGSRGMMLPFFATAVIAELVGAIVSALPWLGPALSARRPRLLLTPRDRTVRPHDRSYAAAECKGMIARAAISSRPSTIHRE